MASPTRTALAPAVWIVSITRASWPDAIMPASSITNTSPVCSPSRPCDQAYSHEAKVRLRIPALSASPSAALPARAAPSTRLPAAVQASCAAFSRGRFARSGKAHHSRNPTLVRHIADRLPLLLREPILTVRRLPDGAVLGLDRGLNLSAFNRMG